MKEAVNLALREGLSQLRQPRMEPRRHRTASVDLGASRLAALDSLGEALAVAEGEDFR
jgi:hypothetical protein